MATTRGSLLLRVKDPENREAWREFHALYSPLLYRYAWSRGLSQADAEEVRDQCLEVIVRKMPTFDYDKEKGGFKNWLRTVVDNKVVDLRRKRRESIANSSDLGKLSDSDPSPQEVFEQEWSKQRVRYCIEKARGRVSERDFHVFHLRVLDDYTVEEVCAQLGLNPNQVYKAKARVFKHVAQIVADLDGDVVP